MVQCLIAGLQAASNKAVNYDKIREILQTPDENPAMFLNRLTEALTQYARLDPASPAGATVLATHFISQSAPDIRKKLKKAEEGPQTPISDLVKMAFRSLTPARKQPSSNVRPDSRRKFNYRPKAW